MAKEEIKIVIETFGGTISSVYATKSSNIKLTVDILDQDEGQTLEGMNTTEAKEFEKLDHEVQEMDHIY